MVEKLILDGTKGAHIIIFINLSHELVVTFWKRRTGKSKCKSIFSLSIVRINLLWGWDLFSCVLSSAIGGKMYLRPCIGMISSVMRIEKLRSRSNYYHPHITYEWHNMASMYLISINKTTCRQGRKKWLSSEGQRRGNNKFHCQLRGGLRFMAFFCCLLRAKEYRSVRLSQAHFMAFRALIGSILLRVSSLRVHS